MAQTKGIRVRHSFGTEVYRTEEISLDIGAGRPKRRVGFACFQKNAGLPPMNACVRVARSRSCWITASLNRDRIEQIGRSDNPVSASDGATIELSGFADSRADLAA